MKVIILPITRLEFEKTAIFIKDYFGIISSKKFRNQFFKAIKMISDNPNIAPKEELLIDEPLNFRSWVINHRLPVYNTHKQKQLIGT